MNMTIYEIDPWRDRFATNMGPRSLWGVAKKDGPFLEIRHRLDDKGDLVEVSTPRPHFTGKAMTERRKFKAIYRRTSTLLSFKEWLRERSQR